MVAAGHCGTLSLLNTHWPGSVPPRLTGGPAGPLPAWHWLAEPGHGRHGATEEAQRHG
jgi:hypothetical protein